MSRSIFSSTPKLMGILLLCCLLSYGVQLHLIYPIESLLGLGITDRASMVFLPAGFYVLTFYLLRKCAIPVIFVARTCIDLWLTWASDVVSSVWVSLVLSLLYPLWLTLFKSAGWDVFGDDDQSKLTITGAMIFAFVVSISSGLISAVAMTFRGIVGFEEALQYLIHFTIGDTLGAGVVIYMFGLSLKMALKLKVKNTQ